MKLHNQTRRDNPRFLCVASFSTSRFSRKDAKDGKAVSLFAVFAPLREQES
jgi:hypothetical protein